MEELSCRVKTTSCQPLSFHWSQISSCQCLHRGLAPLQPPPAALLGGQWSISKPAGRHDVSIRFWLCPRVRAGHTWSTSATGCKASIGSFQCGVERLLPRDLCVHFNLNWTQHHFSSSTNLIYICLRLLIHETCLCLIHEERKTLKCHQMNLHHVSVCLSSNSSRWV